MAQLIDRIPVTCTLARTSLNRVSVFSRASPVSSKLGIKFVRNKTHHSWTVQLQHERDGGGATSTSSIALEQRRPAKMHIVVCVREENASGKGRIETERGEERGGEEKRDLDELQR